MDILKNPFYILGATPRDDRHRIMDLAEERSLLSDADECMTAQSTLIHPRRRISAEVAWLLGVDPDLSDEVLNRLNTPKPESSQHHGTDAYRSCQLTCLWVITSTQPSVIQRCGMDTRNCSSI